MTAERVIEFGFKLMRKEPKIILPNFLNWIPVALFYLTGLFALQRLAGSYDFQSLAMMIFVQNDFEAALPLLGQIFLDMVPFIIVAIIVGVFSWVVSVFLSCTYSEITRSTYLKRKVLLGGAFAVARSKLLSLSWSQLLGFIIMMVLLGLTILSAILIGILIPLIGVIMGVVGFTLILVFGILILWILPAVIVVENLSGFGSLKRGLQIVKQNFWSAFGILLLTIIILTLVFSTTGVIPIVGFYVTLFLRLFFDTWRYLIPTSFYFEYKKKGK